MRLRVIRYGKPAHNEYRSLCEVFILRLRRFCHVELIELRRKPDPHQHALQLRDAVQKRHSKSFLVILDESGKRHDSQSFATALRQWTDDPAIQEVFFVVGDPYGIPDDILKSADLLLRLSDLTFTSDLAELILWEQLYRAYTIIHGIKYHNA